MAKLLIGDVNCDTLSDSSSSWARFAWSPVNCRVVFTLLLWVAARPAYAADTAMPRIVHEACSEYEKGRPFNIVARFEDESKLFDPKVMYRTRFGSRWKSVPLEKVPASESFQATIEANDLRGPLEYFIEVFDEYGNGPARMGSPETPIRVVAARRPERCEQIPVSTAPPVTTAGSAPTPESPLTPTSSETARPTGSMSATTGVAPPPRQGTCDGEERPLYCEAWLWGTVGAVALAGAGAAVYFLVFAGQEESQSPSDSVTLIIDGPDPTTAPLRGR
jgi:hypothetical protein